MENQSLLDQLVYYKLPQRGEEVQDSFHDWVEEHGLEYTSERDETMNIINFNGECLANPGDYILKVDEKMFYPFKPFFFHFIIAAFKDAGINNRDGKEGMVLGTEHKIVKSNNASDFGRAITNMTMQGNWYLLNNHTYHVDHRGNETFTGLMARALVVPLVKP